MKETFLRNFGKEVCKILEKMFSKFRYENFLIFEFLKNAPEPALSYYCKINILIFIIYLQCIMIKVQEMRSTRAYNYSFQCSVVNVV